MGKGVWGRERDVREDRKGELGRGKVVGRSGQERIEGVGKLS